MATYGWGTNEPIIAPEAEGGENIGTVCVKIKSAITDTFTKLNSETWADASTTASGYMSSADKIKLNGIETGAEVNQFAFSNISVGDTTISADTKQDTLTLVAGTGITLTPDAGNDKVTVGFASGANVNIAGSSASCTGNAATATLATTANSCTGNAATATKLQTTRTINGVGFNGTANITLKVFPDITVGTAGTGEGGEILLVQGDSGKSISIDNNRGTFRVFNNPANVVGVLNLNGSGGWNVNMPMPQTMAGVGQIGHLAYSPASVSLPSGGSYYYIFQADHDGHITRFESGIASGGTQIAVNDGYSNNLRLIYIRIA